MHSVTQRSVDVLSFGGVCVQQRIGECLAAYMYWRENVNVSNIEFV